MGLYTCKISQICLDKLHFSIGLLQLMTNVPTGNTGGMLIYDVTSPSS